MEPGLLAELLASIETNNLIIVCGAGLSRTAPSRVPSAAELATTCANQFALSTLEIVPEGAETNLEQLTEFLFRSPIHWRLFLRKLVNWAPFVQAPNRGHFAISDFLSCGAVRFAVTTNFDTLIETAAEKMGEPFFEPALDGIGMQHQYEHRSLLKLHGCARNRESTVWCRMQYDEVSGDPQIRERLQSSEVWLNASLPGCHILIVGFWSDWPHFNDALSRALEANLPASITLVDICSGAELRAKAPALWAVAERLGESFKLVQASGADFLDELRKNLSLQFFGSVLHNSVPTYRDLGGQNVNPAPLSPTDLATDELYDLRRDICGVAPHDVVRDRAPKDNMRGVGAVHLLVQEKGSRFSGNRYKAVDGTTIRVVNGNSDSLHRVKDRFSTGQPASYAGEVVIYMATTGDGGAPVNIARSATIARGVVRAEYQSEWLDLDEAKARGFC
jgi:hypothetical protein